MKHPTIDTAALGRELKARRDRTGESLDDVSRAINTSKSTLSRIERGLGSPDANTVTALTNWLNLPLDRVMQDDTRRRPVTYYPDESTPDIVKAHLIRDPTLTPEAAEALAELFSVAYYQFVKKETRE